MKTATNLHATLLCLLIMMAGIAGTRKKNNTPGSVSVDSFTAGKWIKKARAGEVRLDVLPCIVAGAAAEKNDSYYFRVTLSGNQNFRQPGMQYMNFGITNSFRLLLNNDTLSCSVCDRIPGLIKNTFIYMGRFRKTVVSPAATGLRFCILDTIAGFGITEFNIEEKAIQTKQY